MKIYITLLFALVLSVQCPAQKKLQQILYRYKDSLKFYGITALVAQENTIEEASIGFAYHNQPLEINQTFGIGSLTKTFIATIILKLQDEKLLDINDHIGKYIDPQNKFIDTTITIRQLLNHSSGIKDYSNPPFINSYLFNRKLILSDREILNQVDTVDFVKGAKHEYSNSNYFLLGLIIEKICDKPIPDVIKDKIIVPYHLSNTYPYLNKEIKNMAHPMQNGHDLGDILSYAMINEQGKSVGQIVSCARDLYSFFKLLLADKTILSKQSLSQMLTFEEGDGEEYGLGIFRTRKDGKDFINHTGRVVSYGSRVYYIPQDHLIMVTLTNNMDDHYSAKIRDKIFMEYLR